MLLFPEDNGLQSPLARDEELDTMWNRTSAVVPIL